MNVLEHLFLWQLPSNYNADKTRHRVVYFCLLFSVHGKLWLTQRHALGLNTVYVDKLSVNLSDSLLLELA